MKIKNCIKYILLPAVLIPFLALSSQAAVIAVNAGHQACPNHEKEALGPSSAVMKNKVSKGTCGIVTQTEEYELNLQNALLLREELEKRGHTVVMVRETNDVNISNRERAELALANGAELIINLHANAAGTKQPKDMHGVMTLCRSAKNPFNPKLYAAERRLAACVQNGICSATGAKSIGIIETDSITGINWSTVPSVVAEVGYMTNAEEDLKLSDERYRRRIARGIANGIENYLNAR